MQYIAVRSNRSVHIIFLWIIGLIIGMLVFNHFKQPLTPMIQQVAFAPVSIFSLLLSSTLPLLLVLFLLKLRFVQAIYFIMVVKAFLYGFSLLSFSSCGYKTSLLLFSQTAGCILLILFCLIFMQRSKLSLSKVFPVFLLTNLFLILLDRFIICPMYS